jgi:hypothetical protein
VDEAGAAGWRKSRFSGNGDCVEWRICDDGVDVRHSRDKSGQVVLRFTRTEWIAFLAGVKAGEADLS